jgi:hypothetical protein
MTTDCDVKKTLRNGAAIAQVIIRLESVTATIIQDSRITDTAITEASIENPDDNKWFSSLVIVQVVKVEIGGLLRGCLISLFSTRGNNLIFFQSSKDPQPFHYDRTITK